MPDCRKPRIAAVDFQRNVTNTLSEGSTAASHSFIRTVMERPLCGIGKQMRDGQRFVEQIIAVGCNHPSDRRLPVSELIIPAMHATETASVSPMHGSRWSGWLACTPIARTDDVYYGDSAVLRKHPPLVSRAYPYLRRRDSCGCRAVWRRQRPGRQRVAAAGPGALHFSCSNRDQPSVACQSGRKNLYDYYILAS